MPPCPSSWLRALLWRRLWLRLCVVIPRSLSKGLCSLLSLLLSGAFLSSSPGADQATLCRPRALQLQLRPWSGRICVHLMHVALVFGHGVSKPMWSSRRPVSQATRPRSAAAAPPVAGKRVHACHVCCACVRANVCICLGRHRLCCRCRHHLQLFESVLVVCPSAVWFRTTFRKFRVIFPKVPRWFSKRFALFVSVSVWGLVGSISKSGDSLWTESHCLHRLQMLQMVLGARCPNGARKTQKQMKTKTGTTFFTLLYSEGTTFASSLLTNCFYFSFLFRCLQNKSHNHFANAAVRPFPPPNSKLKPLPT